MRSSFRSFGAALVLSLALAGCGGDEEPAAENAKPTDTATTSQVDTSWTAEVEEACRQSKRLIEETAARARRKGGSRREVAARILQGSIPAQRDTFDFLGTIDDVPADIEPEYDRWVGRLRSTLPLTKQLADDVRAGREDERLTAKFEEIAAQTRPFAEEHGLDACLADAS